MESDNAFALECLDINFHGFASNSGQEILGKMAELVSRCMIFPSCLNMCSETFFSPVRFKQGCERVMSFTILVLPACSFLFFSILLYLVY